MASKTLKPDFCVIGAGSAGLSFAAGAAQMGADVVLIERNKMGGDCLNDGCVPSKALLRAAKVGDDLKNARRFGWHVERAQVDFKQAHQYVHGVIEAIAPHDSVERFESLGVKVLLEDAKFVNGRTVSAGNHVIKAKKFIIATGSHPFVPPIEGLDTIQSYTNENIFDLEALPSHLLVIGGGPIGIELAQAFRHFGSEVTVLEAFKALPKDEPELTGKLKELLKLEGIALQEQVKIDLIKHIDGNVICEFKSDAGTQHRVQASHVLVATGRRPNIASLNLESAGIKFSQQGIEVDKNLRTSNKKVYAVGDCIGGYQFTHVAGYHAGLVIRNSIFKLPVRVNKQAIPWVTYTSPELAHVGYLESELKAKNIPYKKLTLAMKDIDRAQTDGALEGEIIVFASPKGHVLGASILGEHAGEMIYPWVMAIQNKLKVGAIASSIAPYPTLNDGNKRVAGSFYVDKLFSEKMKRIVRFLLRF